MRKSIKYKQLQPLAIAAILFISIGGTADELHQEDGIMTNHSAEYVRTLNRNTSTDPDAAFYNPAGLAFMTNNGLHISFSSQTYYVEKKHSTDFYALKKDSDPAEAPPHAQSWFRGNYPEEYSAKLLAPVLPGFDLIWKQDEWAAYLDIAVMQAAIDMTFEDGLGVMDWGNFLVYETEFDPSKQNLELYSRKARAVRNEMYLGFTVGGAYEITDWISAGGGIRIIHAQGNMKLKMTGINFVSEDIPSSPNYTITSLEDWNIDTDTEGLGYGFIFSTHFKPEGLVSLLKGFEATLRIEYYTPMELKKKTNKFLVEGPLEDSGNLDIFKDGSPSKEMTYVNSNGSKTLKVTYPATVNFGLSYMFFDRLKLMSSSQLSFRQYLDLDGREDAYNMGYQAGLGAEFILTPAITLSAGYLYNNFGIKPEERSEADALLNSHQFGGGVLLHADSNLDINIGAFYQYFIPATAYSVKYVEVTRPTYSYLKKEFKETRISVCIGATYRLFSSEKSSGRKDDENVKDSDSRKDTNKNSIKTKNKVNKLG